MHGQDHQSFYGYINFSFFGNLISIQVDKCMRLNIEIPNLLAINFPYKYV